MGKKIALMIGLIVLMGGLIAVMGLSFYKVDQQVNSEPVTVVAKIGDQAITQEQFIEELKRIYGKEVLNDMINKQVIYKAAKENGISVNQKDIEREYNKLKEGYESETEFASYMKDQMGWTKEELLNNIEYYLIWEELAIKDIVISEEELKSYYKENQTLFEEPEKMNLDQIVVKTKEESNQVIQELNSGSDFSTLARERSTDILTASKGGELGFVTINDPSISSEILQVAKNLKINQPSEPIQIEEGYAVIRVTERVEKKLYPFEEVKDEIKRDLALSQENPLPEVLEELKKNLGVEIVDPVLK